MSRQPSSTLQNNSRVNPAEECILLLEEQRINLGHNGETCKVLVNRLGTDVLAVERPTRVLALFEIFVAGSPAPIPESMLHNQEFTGVEIVGIVATLKAPEGLFAQCGWFGGDDLDWFWARITGWEALHLRVDSRFRGGVPSVALRSAYAEYILLGAHPSYDDCWESTWSFLNAPRCDVWPVGGLLPSWWPDAWASLWPFDRPTGSRRSTSANCAELPQANEALSVAGKDVSTHLGHLDGWQLASGGIVLPSSDHQQDGAGVKRSVASEGLKDRRTKKAKWAPS